MARSISRGARRRDEAGAVAVEFALVVPIMLSLLMGIITFAMAYNQSIALNNTAREGARFGATTANTTGWPAAVETQVKAAYFESSHDFGAQTGDKICAALIKAPASTLRISTGCTTGDAEYPGTPASAVAGTCVVKVWVHQNVELWIGVVSKTIAIEAKSVALYDRTQLCV